MAAVTPCEGRWDLWEDPHYRYAAMQECRTCPIMDACLDRHYEDFAMMRYECVVGGTHTFARDNMGGLTVARNRGGFRVRCTGHKFSTNVRSYEEGVEAATRHAISVEWNTVVLSQ